VANAIAKHAAAVILDVLIVKRASLSLMFIPPLLSCQNDAVASAPRIHNRSVAGGETNAHQEIIGVMVESNAGSHIQLQIRSNEIDRSSDGVLPGSG
jgi:hypothetical protein